MTSALHDCTKPSAGSLHALGDNGRKARHLAIIGCVACLCATIPAHADTRDLDIAIFDPTPSTTGAGFQLQSPDVGSNGAWAARAILSYAHEPLILSAAPNDNTLIQHRVIFELGGAYAFADRFEVGAHMPLYVQSGENLTSPTMFGEPPASGAALGSLTIHGKARTSRYRNSAGLFVTGVGVAVGLPAESEQQFAGSGNTSLRVLGLASFAPTALASRFVVKANVGAVVRTTADFHDIHQTSGALWGLGASYRIRPDLAFAAELFGEIVPRGRREATGGAGVLSAMEALAGAHYRLQRHVDLGVAIGRGITGPGAPALQGLVEVTFSVSPAPLAAIIHLEDDDSDQDGMPDDADRCPDQPEDIDGFEDEDGCPDPDNDGDGIPDATDKCPNAAEDKDGFEDADGCPDPDNDRDGIRDDFDHCPNEPETINGIDDDDGCPDAGGGLVKIETDRIVVAAEPEFTRTGEIASSSFNALGQLAATLRAHPELTKIKVVALPQRARAVVNWLVQWGISADRLEVGSTTINKVNYLIEKRQ